MIPEEIFNKLSESKLLEEVAKKENLVFLGDQETINYLKKVFTNSNNYQYYYWNENQNELANLIRQLNKQKIIIASVINENEIFEKLNKQCSTAQADITLIKLFSDIYINLSLGKELLEPADTKIISPKIAYAVVSTPRSGSNAICEALSSTKIAGFPREDLRYTSQVLSLNCNFDYVKYLKILMSYRVTNNGVFGTKFISHFLQQHEQSKLDFNDIVNNFKFIYLIREDKVEQSVSAFMAQQTNVWHLNSQQNRQQYESLLKEVTFKKEDLQKVHQIHKDMIEQENELQQLLTQYNISPLVVKYSDFEQDHNLVIYQILDYLDIEYDPSMTINLSSKKLQSELSKNIICKYKEQYNCI
ncbi:MAG: Stf0 family sulfotransferase [Waterburya sp.]